LRPKQVAKPECIMQTINLDKLDLQDHQLAIDLGCGLGRHMHAMYFHRRCIAVGIDLGLEDIKATREGFKNAPDLEPQIGAPRHYVLSAGDATQLPFADGKFDRLICSEVLEHIPDVERAIDEIWRIMKPGSRIGISVPRAWPEKICWLLSDDYHNEPGGHVRIFNARALRHSFEQRGFVFSGKHHAHGLHSPYWWLKCLVGVKNDRNLFVRLYHKILVVEILQNPWYLKLISKITDPLMGKSVVLYFNKPK
jgi:SAM-dependent methyltransferase